MLKKREAGKIGCGKERKRDSGDVMLDLRSRLLDSRSEAPPIPASRFLNEVNPDSRREAPPERSAPTPISRFLSKANPERSAPDS